MTIILLYKISYAEIRHKTIFSEDSLYTSCTQLKIVEEMELEPGLESMYQIECTKKNHK